MTKAKISKADFCDAVALESRVDPRLVRAAIDGMAAVLDNLVVGAGNSLTLPGFGTFRCRETAARMGRNPRTGEAVPVPARRSLAFRASKNAKV